MAPRSAAQQALGESEGRFRSLAKLSNDFYWETDAEHRYTVLDFGAVHRGEHQKWKKLGKRPWDIPYTSPDEAGWASHRATIAARKAFVDFTMSRVARGEERFYELSGEPRFDSGGAFLGYQGVGRETTPRIRAERALRQSQERYALAMEASEEGHFDWTVQSDEIFLSHAVQKLLGVPADRSFAKRADLIAAIPYHPDDIAWLQRMTAEVLNSTAVRHSFEYRVMVGGDTRWLHVRWRILRDEAGAAQRIIGVANDITSRKEAETALRLSEERYARAMLSANAGFWDWDVEKDEYYTSPRFIEMVGFPPGTTFAGREDFHYRTNYFPEDREKWREGVRKLFAGSGSRLAMEVRVTVAGETRWHAMHGMCFRENGRVIRWTGYATDVTERKRAEEALRLSEERYARAIEGADVGHWDCNLVTEEMFVSERARALLGLPDGPLPATWREIMALAPMHPEDRAVMDERVAASIAAGTHEREYRLIPRPGMVRWVRTQGKVFRDASGAGVRLTGSIADITERKVAAEALAVSEARYARAMEASEAGHFEWDIATDEMFLSARMKVMLGFTPDTPFANRAEFVDKQNFLPGERQRLEEALRGSFADPEGRYEIDYRIRLPSDEARWMRSQGKLFRDDDGKPVRMAGSMTDVTERKQGEEELRKLEQKLRRAQRLEAMGTLAGGIAHDFNNILHAILGYGEIAAGAAKKQTRLRHAIDSIVAAGERGRRLVDRILAFSRSGVAERVAVHVEEVVREALNQLAATVPDKVTVASRLRAGRAAMLGDSTQVHQLVMNLANNAVQAMPHGGVLRIELEVQQLVSERLALIGTIGAGEYIVLRVSDTGTGIPPAVFEHMFDPFFSTKEIGVGSGLGLSLVHGIVINVGGAIDVVTEPGTGSGFTVYLPRHGDAPRRSLVKKRPLPRGSGQRVLVVDDEEPLVRLATQTLKQLGYAPTGFTSSVAALAAFRADPNRFDVVLTDERMPGLSGSTLIREMRVFRAAIPVVLMTGYLGIDCVEADVVVRKPLSARELAASVARALHS
jgi:PAS domain S-box-containing protein